MNELVTAMAGSSASTEHAVVPETETRTTASQLDPANDWLCAWCRNRIASEQDRFCYEGKSEFSFTNPERVRFDVLTFARTLGCRDAGAPTLADTWFPGHAWSYCLCDRCRMHLGWRYAGPHEFAALIRDRLVRALLTLS